MRSRINIVLYLAAVLIFVPAAVVEIRERLRQHRERLESINAYIKSQAAEAEELRRLGRETFLPESRVTFAEGHLDYVRRDPRPFVQGFLKAILDVCLLLPLGLFTAFIIATVARHPIRKHLGRLFIQIGLPLLGAGVALFLLWLLAGIIFLGPLAVPAG
jgi:hypothetical protein